MTSRVVLPFEFTAFIMANPAYLAAVKNIPQAKDDRAAGLERLNAFQAAANEKQIVRREKKWSP